MASINKYYVSHCINDSSRLQNPLEDISVKINEHFYFCIAFVKKYIKFYTKMWFIFAILELIQLNEKQGKKIK